MLKNIRTKTAIFGSLPRSVLAIKGLSFSIKYSSLNELIYNKAESPTLKHISFNSVFSWCQDFFCAFDAPPIGRKSYCSPHFWQRYCLTFEGRRRLFWQMFNIKASWSIQWVTVTLNMLKKTRKGFDRSRGEDVDWFT